MRKLKFNKFGLAENPRNLHCVLRWQGQQLLGEIIGAQYDSVIGQTKLNVIHMNGQWWPIQPVAMAVNIL